MELFSLTTSCFWSCDGHVSRITLAICSIVSNDTVCIWATSQIVTFNFLAFAILAWFCSSTIKVLATCAAVVCTCLAICTMGVFSTSNWKLQIWIKILFNGSLWVVVKLTASIICSCCSMVSWITLTSRGMVRNNTLSVWSTGQQITIYIFTLPSLAGFCICTIWILSTAHWTFLVMASLSIGAVRYFSAFNTSFFWSCIGVESSLTLTSCNMICYCTYGICTALSNCWPVHGVWANNFNTSIWACITCFIVSTVAVLNTCGGTQICIARFPCVTIRILSASGASLCCIRIWKESSVTLASCGMICNQTLSINTASYWITTDGWTLAIFTWFCVRTIRILCANRYAQVGLTWQPVWTLSILCALDWKKSEDSKILWCYRNRKVRTVNKYIAYHSQHLEL